MTTPREHILVVDDDESMLYAIQRVLRPHYRVTTAATGEDALAILEKSEANTFNVALVDIQLTNGPDDEGLDGYQVCQQAREIRPEIDVILMTGSRSQADEKLFMSLERDAFYVLFKPFERRVLRALLERCLRLQRERAAKEKFAAELERDLEQARDFQRSLLPDRSLTASGWSMNGRFFPCDQLGGDLYFYQRQRDDSIIFSISDIVGHGVRAAMYASMLRSTIDAARRGSPDPDVVLPEIMRGIDFFEDNRFASSIYGKLCVDGQIQYFNAGHPPIYILRKTGGMEELAATGLPLSNALRDYPRQVAQTSMAPGDRLLVYTDGIPEATDPHDEPFDFNGLKAAFRAGATMSLDGALDHILSELERHTDGRPLDDDVTLLMIERLTAVDP